MSKWIEATDRYAKAKEARRPSPPPRKSPNLPALLPLLLLLVLGLWVWKQMQVPMPGSPSALPATISPDTSPARASSSDSEDARQQPTTSTPTSTEPTSTHTSVHTIPSEEEEAEAASSAETKTEAEVPPGGESPLAWRPITPSSDRPAELSDWYKNHDGYISALRRRSHVTGSMILYFRTDWCPWSRRFEDEFLNNRAIANWASEQIRVVLDPEAGFEEAELVRRFGITGFPAFFVIPQAGKPVPLRPYPEGNPVSITTFLNQARYASKP